MAEASIFDEIPEEISQHLISFSESIDDIGKIVTDIQASKKEAINATEGEDTLEKIKSELSLCYTYNALYFMYLRCNGVDTSNHPIMQELDRVMTALKRCRALTEKKTTSTVRCDKEAASRFIKHALWQSAHSKAKKRRTETDASTSN